VEPLIGIEPMTSSLPWKKLLLSNFSAYYHLYGKALILGHLEDLAFNLFA